tara:strand:+ start:408 stop:1706 length:1299 start_codon:yes stop_codon:yes gene_type:complete
MSPQLTLQSPLQLPPEEIPSYLNKLWGKDKLSDAGANTFSLIVWQPAWIEQELVRNNLIKGPIIGNVRNDLINASRNIILKENLPHSTAPLDENVREILSKQKGAIPSEDLRGQYIDSSISILNPRRLVTLAPTINNGNELETLVAAYCPLFEDTNNESCGDVVVLRGNIKSLNKGLDILREVIPKDIPSWLWWNGRLDEAPELLKQIVQKDRRLIIDTAMGCPLICLRELHQKILAGQAVNDLNWLRLRSWRETLAMIFDPQNRRIFLNEVIKVDIDFEGTNPVQGLLLAAWISDRLNWRIEKCNKSKCGDIHVTFKRLDGEFVSLNLISMPVGKPSIHEGQVVGMRLICVPKTKQEDSICVILASESSECMRLEAGGMASMELIEEVVPIQKSTIEMDVARLLSSSRGTTSPLLAAAAPIASQIFESAKD